RIGDDEVELGLGIHGEPGASLLPFAPVDALVRTMVDALGARASGRIALLVNDLGGVPPIELGVVTNATLDALPNAALVFGPGRYMTS
ncbi:dihydroxyacetone kinase subunit DhaK, partial [Acinetobacter baumannii]